MTMHQYDEWELEDIKNLIAHSRNAEALPRLYRLAAAYPYNQEIQSLIVKLGVKNYSWSKAFYAFWAGFAFQIMAVLLVKSEIAPMLWLGFATASIACYIMALYFWLGNRYRS